MKNEIEKLVFEQEPVRMLTLNEELMWVAMDLTKILAYRDTNDMVRRLDPDEYIKVNIKDLKLEPVSNAGSSWGGARQVILVNEAGLYNAILGSNKPVAKRFKRWITHEVLPSIRKSGAYITRELEEKLNALQSAYIELAGDNARLQQISDLFGADMKNYGRKNKNGDKRTQIRRGSIVANKGRIVPINPPTYNIFILGKA